MSEDSTPNNSPSLSERLAKKKAEDRQAFEEQTQRVLSEHASSLQQLSNDALVTTKSAINNRSQQIDRELQNQRDAITEQTDELIDHQIRAARQLKWALKLPLITLVIVCLVSFSSIWVWWEIQKPWTVAPFDDGQTYQVLEPGWGTCSVNGQERPCRPVSGD